MRDFSDAKVGDKVKSKRFGKGVITGIAFEDEYSIFVKFNALSTWFTIDGREYSKKHAASIRGAKIDYRKKTILKKQFDSNN